MRFTNTLTGRKEELRPLNPPQVTMYVCGVTVYDDCHIGHARGAVVFDVLRRTLEAQGLKVIHVRNITDVDDKIIDRARSWGQTPEGLTPSGLDLKAACREVAQRYEASFREDFAKLGLLPPTHEPRATEFIPKMVDFIQLLIQRGIAYQGSDGVYLSVREFARRNEYGKLSHQNLDQMLEGVRKEPGEGKRDPLDFALWKKAKPEEPSWESPWGAGRPGWHIECSAMSTALLGDTFDIHGGGQDLIFPHHENELVQAEGAGKPFARFWLHNGLLTVNGQKMSKSLGNVVSIQDALKRHPNPDVLRLFFLSAHYRSPLDFTWERYEESAQAYDRISAFLCHADALGQTESQDLSVADQEEGFHNWYEQSKDGFAKALDDDLNTPEAIASIQNFVWMGNFTLQAMVTESTKGRIACVRILRDEVYKRSKLLGFSLSDVEARPDEVDRLVEERNKFRRMGGYASADMLRKQLMEMGYVIEDTAAGTIVRKQS